MRCPRCNSEMTCKPGNHLYDECGVDNVTLKQIDIYSCTCGEKIVLIPEVAELHNLIGLQLIKKKSLLSGKEIRFLRKNMGLTAKKLADYIGVENVTISRWENSKNPISKPHDLFLRVVYSNIKGISPRETRHLIEDDFKRVQPKQKKVQSYTIPRNEWSGPVCAPA